MPYTPLMSEILDKVAKAKTKEKKVGLLREHNSPSLRMVLKASFDPSIKWQLPEGDVRFSYDHGSGNGGWRGVAPGVAPDLDAQEPA